MCVYVWFIHVNDVSVGVWLVWVYVYMCSWRRMSGIGFVGVWVYVWVYVCVCGFMVCGGGGDVGVCVIWLYK